MVTEGWADVFVQDWSQTWSETLTWYQGQYITAQKIWGKADGLTVSGAGFLCRGQNCKVIGSYPRQPVKKGYTPLGQAIPDPIISAKKGTSGRARFVLEFVFHKPGYTSSDPLYARPPEVRCDHRLPGNTKPGCVFPGHAPTMIYGMGGPYPELARHIRDAQKSGLASAYPNGKPLERTAPGNVEKNRGRACPRGKKGYPRPKGPPSRTCDEYPFASTQQGARTANPDTPPRQLRRTFKWCRMPKVVPTDRKGAKGYSICFIHEVQNRTGGGALDAFYRD